jgi:epoxyqueuosine reductase
MKALIRARAIELGFDACRFTAATPPAGAARLEAWLAAGYHGEMAYLARNAAKRADPRLVLPGARSVICLAASYHQPLAAGDAPSARPPEEGFGGPRPAREAERPAAAPARVRGVVARYARFADYHEVLAAPLRALTEFVNRLGGPDTRSLGYVDTGPVLERELAQRAGLGFIGKHTNLIHRGLGNWFFIAEILTTLELEPDPPEPNRCGTCTRCLAACPTGALPAPFVLDARRCISYLTIEHKGPIPVELRPALGTRIFGCDDCLEVCPWNRFAREGRLLRAHARPDLTAPELVALLGLDEAGFKARFAGTPLARAKRRGLLRNVCVALGNAGDPRALPALERAAADPEPLIAEHARWAISRLTRAPAEPTPA